MNQRVLLYAQLKKHRAARGHADWAATLEAYEKMIRGGRRGEGTAGRGEF